MGSSLKIICCKLILGGRKQGPGSIRGPRLLRLRSWTRGPSLTISNWLLTLPGKTEPLSSKLLKCHCPWFLLFHIIKTHETYSKFPLAIYITYTRIYASMLLSAFISASPSSPLLLSISLFSVSASPLLPVNRFINTIFLDSITGAL